MLRIVDIVSDFEDGSLGLQVVEDLGVHLDLKLVSFMEDRIQTVVEHASGLLGLGELVAQGLVLFKD